ncbi:MAG: hypothetical protein KatS3mg024_2337 [Armatimonadota bacterium]|nr:MAG: hypothetical protein KatS3mg024_2337 [Armatimonadota bacterium]
MKIEFLYFEDCPSHAPALQRLRNLVEQENLRADLCIVRIETDEQAQSLRFPGSPTIRVDGQDIDPEGAAANPVGLSCRVYRTSDGRFTPLPPEDLMRQALRRAAGQRTSD